MEKRDAKLQNKKTKKISGRRGQTAVTILHVKHGGAAFMVWGCISARGVVKVGAVKTYLNGGKKTQWNTPKS